MGPCASDLTTSLDLAIANFLPPEGTAFVKMYTSAYPTATTASAHTRPERRPNDSILHTNGPLILVRLWECSDSAKRIQGSRLPFVTTVNGC